MKLVNFFLQLIIKKYFIKIFIKAIDKIEFMCYNTFTSVERLFLCAILGHAHISTLREVFNGLCPNLLGGAEKL